MKQYNIEQPQNVVVKIVFLILLVNYTSSIASAEMQHLSQSSYCRLLASCRPNEGSVGASALPLRCDMEIGMSAFPKLAIA
jgi:hypothetical protein